MRLLLTILIIGQAACASSPEPAPKAAPPAPAAEPDPVPKPQTAAATTEAKHETGSPADLIGQLGSFSDASDTQRAAEVIEPGQPLPKAPGFYGLGLADSSDCDGSKRLEQLGSGCQMLRLQPARSADNAAAAFDRNVCTNWNSGERPPRQITAKAKDRQVTFSMLLLQPKMEVPTADVTHVVEVADPGARFRTLAILSGVMEDNNAYLLRLSNPITVQRVRVRTAASPSWVAWYEIALISCSQ